MADKEHTAAPKASEKVLEAALRTSVKAKGGIAIKLLPSLAGLPDRMVLMPRGRIWFIELKTTGYRLKPLQKWWRNYLRSLGFEWRFIDRESNLLSFLNEL